MSGTRQELVTALEQAGRRLETAILNVRGKHTALALGQLEDIENLIIEALLKEKKA